jgi:hypothetical protein
VSQDEARAIVGKQMLTEAWDDFLDREWAHPQYGLSDKDWQAALEAPFASYPEYRDLQKARRDSGGSIDS